MRERTKSLVLSILNEAHSIGEGILGFLSMRQSYRVAIISSIQIPFIFEAMRVHGRTL